MQFDIGYDSGLLTYISAASGTLTSNPDFIISANTLETDKVRVLIMNYSGSCIPQGEGSIIMLGFQVASDAQNGQSCSLPLSSVYLSDIDAQEIPGVDLINGSFIVESCQKGDVNCDGLINVQDVVRTVNIILGKITPTAEERNSADANGDGVVNVQDVVKIVNMILGKSS